MLYKNYVVVAKHVEHPLGVGEVIDSILVQNRNIPKDVINYNYCYPVNL